MSDACFRGNPAKLPLEDYLSWSLRRPNQTYLHVAHGDIRQGCDSDAFKGCWLACPVLSSKSRPKKGRGQRCKRHSPNGNPPKIDLGFGDRVAQTQTRSPRVRTTDRQGPSGVRASGGSARIAKCGKIRSGGPDHGRTWRELGSSFLKGSFSRAVCCERKFDSTWSLLLTLSKWVHDPLILGNDQPIFKGRGDSRQALGVLGT